MYLRVRKRNNRLAKFDKEKILRALKKTGEATQEFGEDKAHVLLDKVLELMKEKVTEKVPTVEQIQDCVEEVLLSSRYKKTAKAFILYRDQHAKLREIVSVSNVNLIDQYLEKLDWKVKENSNMTYSLQGLNNYISSEISKVYWLNKIYPQEVRDAHMSGDIHIHDLTSIATYCLGWDIQDLLTVGFKGVPGKVESRPAKHFQSALGQSVNFLYTLAGECAGAQAFSSFDIYMAPFIRFDNLSYAEVKSAVKSFIYNMNISTRVGFQPVFSNVTLDLQIPKSFKDTPAIIGGVKQKEVYGDFQKEVDTFNKAFWEVMYEGDAKGRVFTFPIPTINITKDFDWDNPNHDIMWKVTARTGNPYFANFVNSDLDPDDVRSMCCRLRINNKELKKRGGGLFGANPLTGSCGVVTINMNRIGFTSDNEKEFFEKLDRLMVISKESLEIKRKVLEDFMENNLYPYSKYYLRIVKERFDKYWVNHFSTIGLIGMNESCLNFMGVDIGDPKAQEFSLRVLDYMNKRLLEFQQETGNLYNLEATPAEGATYRLAGLDRKMYPEIIVSNDAESTNGFKPYLTGSTQLPVEYTSDAFKVLHLQNELQTKYTGGTVIHFFISETPDPMAVKSFIKRVCEKSNVPYITVTPTFSICPEHGIISGVNKTCKICGAVCEVYSRVVGYLRPVSQWNDAQQGQFVKRKYFDITKIEEDVVVSEEKEKI